MAKGGHKGKSVKKVDARNMKKKKTAKLIAEDMTMTIGGQNKKDIKKTEKAPSAKGARVIKNMAPKVIENTKNAIFLRGSKTSETVTETFKELYSLRKPHGKMMSRKNENMHPFEDSASLEFLCQKNDCSLFCVANHSKKRPNNLVLGRTFDGHILDMAELGVETITTIADLQAVQPEGGASLQTKRLGSKPCVVFLGEPWEASAEHRSLRSLLLDFVRGQDVTGINLAALDHVIAFTAVGDAAVKMRTYVLDLRKPAGSGEAETGAIGGSNVPVVKLGLSAPAMDFTVRRTRWASRDLMKQALKQPRELRPKKVKNISTSSLGETMGQLHMTRQDYGKLQTRKVKALHAHKAVEVMNVNDDDDDVSDSGEV